MEALIERPMATLPHTSPQAWPQPATIEELGSTALTLSTAAATRFKALSEEMERYGRSELAAVFDRLAAEQNSMTRAILDRGSWQPEGAPHASNVSWDTSNGAGLEGASDLDDEARNPHLSSPYKALAFAVRMAERDFRFYSYVAAMAANDDVRRLAEWLATEGLTLAGQRRARRRGAYHAQRGADDSGADDNGGAARALNPILVDSMADLLSAATVMEQRMAQRLASAVAAGAELAPLSGQVRLHVDELTLALRVCGDPCSSPEWAPADFTDTGTPRNRGDEGTPARDIGFALAEGERAFAFYSAVVSTASNEAVMLEAQRLSQDILPVIAALRAYRA
jgi:hypothetical protein